jgi:hypothetical protein
VIAVSDQMAARPLPPPVAEDARPAAGPGLCCLCGGRYARGDRIAKITGRGWADVYCIALAVAAGELDDDA